MTATVGSDCCPCSAWPGVAGRSRNNRFGVEWLTAWRESPRAKRIRTFAPWESLVSQAAAPLVLVHKSHAPGSLWTFKKSGHQVASISVSGPMFANISHVLKHALLNHVGLAFLPLYT